MAPSEDGSLALVLAGAGASQQEMTLRPCEERHSAPQFFLHSSLTQSGCSLTSLLPLPLAPNNPPKRFNSAVTDILK